MTTLVQSLRMEAETCALVANSAIKDDPWKECMGMLGRKMAAAADKIDALAAELSKANGDWHETEVARVHAERRLESLAAVTEHSIKYRDARIRALEAENARLNRFADFLCRQNWTSRGRAIAEEAFDNAVRMDAQRGTAK
jgi:hypothetical protein